MRLLHNSTSNCNDPSTDKCGLASIPKPSICGVAPGATPPADPAPSATSIKCYLGGMDSRGSNYTGVYLSSQSADENFVLCVSGTIKCGSYLPSQFLDMFCGGSADGATFRVYQGLSKDALVVLPSMIQIMGIKDLVKCGSDGCNAPATDKCTNGLLGSYSSAFCEQSLPPTPATAVKPAPADIACFGYYDNKVGKEPKAETGNRYCMSAYVSCFTSPRPAPRAPPPPPPSPTHAQSHNCTHANVRMHALTW